MTTLLPGTYTDQDLKLDYEPAFFSVVEAAQIFLTLEGQMTWGGANNTRRRSRTFGDTGLVYTLNFRGQTVERPAVPWSYFPLLAEIGARLTTLTGQTYNICVLQRYPNGRCGIAPHRDREMTPGTHIAGLSFGSARVLSLTRGLVQHRILLIPGSLYILQPPTNDFWAHSIEKDDSTDVRISLTYRNYVK